MVDSTLATEGHPGPDLKRLREGAGKTQAEMAAALNMDASKVSRIEAGLVSPTNVQVDKYLHALGTPLAKEYRKYHLQDWNHLACPSFWHPDRDALREADEALGVLGQLDAKLDAGSPLKAQVDLHRKTIQRAVDYLQRLDHDLVAIGTIAVGKTTALCCQQNLMLPPDGKLRLRDRVVLETGQGRTTLCEVVVRRGPKYGIVVEAQTENEIRALIRDLCLQLVPEPGEPASEEGVSEEVGRALRNMAGLGYEVKTSPEGKRTEVDRAAQFLKGISTLEERRAAFFNRLRLDQRTVTQLWHDDAPNTKPLEWLKETFLKVNNGMHPEVPLPQRIVVLVPEPVLGEAEHVLSWVDTKGIDQTAVRPDIQRRLDDPRSLLLLCSRFPDAPSQSAQQLIEHAWDTGSRSALAHRVVLVVLTRGEEALEMKDDARRLVETTEEGYAIRARQIRDTPLFRQGAAEVPVVFMNATSEKEVAGVRRQIVQLVRRMRRAYAGHIADVNRLAKQLLKGFATALSQAAHAEVGRQLAIFLKRNAELPAPTKPVYMHLLHVVRNTHPMTVRASARRYGDWHNLDAYLVLGTGAAMDAQGRSNKFFSELEGLVGQLSADKNLEPTHEFLRQLQQNAGLWREEFVEAVRRAAEEMIRPPLYGAPVWVDCASQRGTGFRNRVADLLGEWFNESDNTELLDALEAHVQREWQQQVIAKFRELSAPVASGGTTAA